LTNRLGLPFVKFRVCHAGLRAVLHFVEPQRVYPPETTAAMTAAFERLCASIPKSVNGDDLRRQLALVILRHVDRGVQDPERLSEMAFRELAGLSGSASECSPTGCVPAGDVEGARVPITSFLNGVRFDRKTTRIMGVAFERTRVALGIAERRDDVNEIVAKTIVELTKQGERNPDLLCERALQSLREQYLTDITPTVRAVQTFGRLRTES